MRGCESVPAAGRRAIAALQHFDLIVVRGRQARRFFAGRGIKSTIAIIPGGICASRFKGVQGRRDVDMIFVGRLTDIKQPVQFIEIVAEVKRKVPESKPSSWATVRWPPPCTRGPSRPAWPAT